MEKRVLEWSVHPVKENRKTSLAVVLFLLLFWTAIYLVFRELVWVLLAVVLLGGSLFSFFTVTAYRLDEKGVTIKRPLTKVFREWSRVRSFYPDRKGVLLSPFATPSRLENHRGIYLRFGSNREEVLVYLKEQVSAGDAPVEAGKKDLIPG